MQAIWHQQGLMRDRTRKFMAIVCKGSHSPAKVPWNTAAMVLVPLPTQWGGRR